MDTTPDTIISTCPNCGGKLSFSYITNRNVCEYCGGQFDVPAGQQYEATDDPSPDKNAGCVPFTRTTEEFKEKALKWFAEGDYTPVSLLFPSSPYIVTKAYIPVYFFSGRYEGTYTTEDLWVKETANIPLSGQYTVSCYGSDSMDVDKAVADYTISNIRPETFVPLASVVLDGIELKSPCTPDTAWRRYGQLKAADDVYKKLEHADPGKKHKHYLKYQHDSVALSYLPCWYIQYEYSGSSYSVYIDDATGEIGGIKPHAYEIIPPTRAQVFKKSALTGLLLWFILFVLRGAYGAYKGHSDGLNNLLMSPPGESYWFMRGGFFLLTIPLLMSTVFYPFAKSRYLDKFAQLRRAALDTILTGRRPSIFN